MTSNNNDEDTTHWIIMPGSKIKCQLLYLDERLIKKTCSSSSRRSRWCCRWWQQQQQHQHSSIPLLSLEECNSFPHNTHSANNKCNKPYTHTYTQQTDWTWLTDCSLGCISLFIIIFFPPTTLLLHSITTITNFLLHSICSCFPPSYSIQTTGHLALSLSPSFTFLSLHIPVRITHTHT